jgi:hypothetical protein
MGGRHAGSGIFSVLSTARLCGRLQRARSSRAEMRRIGVLMGFAGGYVARLAHD